MTLFEALKAKVKYPLSDDFIKSILIERGLIGDDEYTQEVAASNKVKGARADLLIGQIDCPQIQEGGMSISLTDKSNFISVANSIYAEIGESQYGQAQSSVTYIDA